VNIPILGRLMGGESTDREKSDLLIALVPHIVRTPDVTDVDVKEVLAGSDQVVRVSYAPRTAPVPAAAPPAPAAAAPTSAPAPAPVPPAPIQPTIPGVPSPAGPRLTLAPPASKVPLGGTVTLTLQAENLQDLFTASPVRFKWDSRVLRLNDIATGTFLAHGDQRVTSAKDIRNDAGEAWITMNRLPGAGGVNGSGALATLSFSVIGKGNTKVTVTECGLRNTQLQPIPVTGPEAGVDVQ
jgi:general secretion pathway protein D